MIFDMNKDNDFYPWKPIEITADDLETEEGERKMRLVIHRARLAVGAASIRRILMAQKRSYGEDVTE